MLTSTSDLLQIVTGATQSIQVHASWIDSTGTTTTPGRQNTIITTATTTTVVASPTSGVARDVKALVVENAGTAAELVTVEHTDGTHVVQLVSMNLPAGNALEWAGKSGWRLVGSTGTRQL